jgi:hypothetical protein
MSSIDSPTSGPKGLNTHSHSEQPQPQKIFDPHQFATRRFHGHLEICCGYALVKDGVPLVFDGIATTKTALFLAPTEVLP